MVADRLLGEQFLAVVHVEPPEIDDLARRVDLGLKDRLRLAEHRRAVDGVAPRRAQQFRGLEQHRRAIVERPTRPLALRGDRRLDRLLHMFRRGFVKRPEHVMVIVRHHDVAGVAGADLLAADDDRNVDLFAGHRARAGLDGCALRRARFIRSDGIVGRRRDAASTVEGSG